jgi:type I restriction enzyme S subunit
VEEFIWEKINESKFIMLKELNKDFKETAIGLIPEDWEVKKLREVSKNRNSSLSINNLLDNNGKYVLYGAGGFLKRIDFYEEDEKYISIIKDGAGVGRVFLCDEFSSILGTMSYIKPINNNISLHYLYFLYQTINFEKYITGSTIPHIYFSYY